MVKKIIQFILSFFAKKKVVSSPPVIEPPLVPPAPIEPNPLSSLEKWGLAIRTMEGWYEGSVSQRNRNPGNIKALGGSFLKFDTYEEGWEYLLDYLTRAATDKHAAYNSNMTLRDFTKVYAPSSDGNSPDTYADFVANELNVSVETKIKSLV